MKNKKGYRVDLEKETKRNGDFRRVLYTGKNSQLVLMSLRPKEEIGAEVHANRDQFFRFEAGKGLVIINNTKYRVQNGSGIIVPAGARHNVINTSAGSNLKLYTIYSPPEHQDKVVRHTKKEAMARPEEFNGRTTE